MNKKKNYLYIIRHKTINNMHASIPGLLTGSCTDFLNLTAHDPLRPQHVVELLALPLVGVLSKERYGTMAAGIITKKPFCSS